MEPQISSRQPDSTPRRRCARAPQPCAAPKRRHAPGYEETDVALEAWARWARSGLAGLGWPARTLLARIMKDGTRGAAQSGCLVLEVDEAMEIVERAVLRLSDIERLTVCRHYLYWQPPEVSARYCGMTPNHFHVVLCRGRRSIRDYLEGVKAQRLRDRLHY